MSALTDKQHCRADCPPGNHAYKNRGEVVVCEHGAVFMVRVRYVEWTRRFNGLSNFQRLSRFWTPRRYKRAMVDLAGRDL